MSPGLMPFIKGEIELPFISKWFRGRGNVTGRIVDRQDIELMIGLSFIRQPLSMR